MRYGASPRRLTPNRRLDSIPSDSAPLELDNGLLIDGGPGAEPRWNHKDRSARPVRCSVVIPLHVITSPAAGQPETHQRKDAPKCRAYGKCRSRVESTTISQVDQTRTKT